MPPPTTTSPPAPPPQQHRPTNNLPSLPTPPPWLLPTALLLLTLSVLATLLVYRLTFPHGASAPDTSAHLDHTDEEAALDTHIPRFATGASRPAAGRPRTRIQRIWSERRQERARREGAQTATATETEMETLLPATPKRWADGGGGGSGASLRGWEGGRRRGGYVRVAGEEEEEEEGEGGSGIEVVEVDDGAREEGGWLRMVDAGVEWCVEKAAGYLGDEGGEEGLVFPVTEEERGERVGWD